MLTLALLSLGLTVQAQSGPPQAQSRPPQAQSGPPRSYLDQTTGHKVIRLTDEPTLPIDIIPYKNVGFSPFCSKRISAMRSIRHASRTDDLESSMFSKNQIARSGSFLAAAASSVHAGRLLAMPVLLTCMFTGCAALMAQTGGQGALEGLVLDATGAVTNTGNIARTSIGSTSSAFGELTGQSGQRRFQFSGRITF